MMVASTRKIAPLKARRQAGAGSPKKSAIKRIEAREPSMSVSMTGKEQDLTYSEIYSAQPQERILMVKQGVPAYLVVDISQSMGITKESLFTTLGLPKSTVDKKIAANQPLPADQAERVFGMAKLVGQVQVMVEQSGEPKGFDAARWVAGWLATPSPALGGATPASYMDTAEGQELVSGLIAKMQSGAYA
jgi:putative toxin-antitoxin system antitoxin component (TIGR02293 family)